MQKIYFFKHNAHDDSLIMLWFHEQVLKRCLNWTALILKNYMENAQSEFVLISIGKCIPGNMIHEREQYPGSPQSKHFNKPFLKPKHKHDQYYWIRFHCWCPVTFIFCAVISRHSVCSFFNFVSVHRKTAPGHKIWKRCTSA